MLELCLANFTSAQYRTPLPLPSDVHQGSRFSCSITVKENMKTAPHQCWVDLLEFRNQPFPENAHFISMSHLSYLWTECDSNHSKKNFFLLCCLNFQASESNQLRISLCSALNSSETRLYLPLTPDSAIVPEIRSL